MEYVALSRLRGADASASIKKTAAGRIFSIFLVAAAGELAIYLAGVVSE
jgi:hypothetical protein